MREKTCSSRLLGTTGNWLNVFTARCRRFRPRRSRLWCAKSIKCTHDIVRALVCDQRLRSTIFNVIDFYRLLASRHSTLSQKDRVQRQPDPDGNGQCADQVAHYLHCLTLVRKLLKMGPR